MTPWQECCSIALALYAVAKVWTFACAFRRGLAFGTGASLGYLVLWPGMDPGPFARDAGPASPRPSRRDWLAAGRTTLVGGVVLLTACLPLPPLARGLLTLIGAVLLLHFGLFQLTALSWRRAGIDVVPLMRSPATSRSLGELWARRWNTGFHELARSIVHDRLRPLVGTRIALLTTFLASGLVHELAITVPARGGFGGPTLYFLLQGLGVLAERAPALRRRLSKRERRTWTWLVAALPTPLLFPPVFLTRVAADFGEALLAGALREPATLARLVESWLAIALPLAALANLCVLVAGAQLPFRLRWREELPRLSRFNRRIFLTYYGFTGGTVVAFAALTWFLRDEILAGERAALVLTLCMGLYWSVRILVDLFVFRAEDWPRGAGLALGRALLLFAFVAMAGTYLGAWTYHLSGLAPS